MTDKINTYVQLYLDDVELNISVNNNLKKYEEEESLHHFGYIQITDGALGDKPIFWDNLNFFISAGKKEFKGECKKELEKKGYNWKETYKIIKALLKRAKKLNLL